MEIATPLSVLALLGSGLIAGVVLYFVGCLLVTILGNVPLNGALAKLAAADPKSEDVWRRYLVQWTRWNHVRTAASLAAALAFSLATNHLAHMETYRLIDSWEWKISIVKRV